MLSHLQSMGIDEASNRWTALHQSHRVTISICDKYHNLSLTLLIPFINKGIEFIDLHSIFKDNSVISSIPNYFNNSETPIICYKYNKPIRSTIFNFNKIDDKIK